MSTSGGSVPAPDWFTTIFMTYQGFQLAGFNNSQAFALTTEFMRVTLGAGIEAARQSRGVPEET